MFSHYENKLAKMEEELESLSLKTAEIKSENAKQIKVAEVKKIFSKMAGNKYSNDELIRYSKALVEESERYNIDPTLVTAIIATESNFRYNVVSNKGAIGMMQLLPSTAFYISGKNHIDFSNKNQLFDPEMNIRLGVSYLAYLIEKTGSVEHAIIAYNYGPVNLKRALNNNKALPQKYMRTVMKNYDKAKAFTS